eukprot:1541650-Rhodomonas_salina.7
MSVRHGLRKVEESGLVEYATGQVGHCLGKERVHHVWAAGLRKRRIRMARVEMGLREGGKEDSGGVEQVRMRGKADARL